MQHVYAMERKHYGVPSGSAATLPMAFAASIRSAIAEHDGRPFIIVHTGRTGASGTLVCSAEEELPSFIETLAELSLEVARSPLFTALEHVLRNEVYEGAYALFDWIHLSVGVDRSRIVLWGADHRGLAACPVYDLCGTRAINPAGRAAMLLASFEAYEAAIGNDATRCSLLETFAFALSRHFGLTGAYDTALSCVDRAQSLVDHNRAPGSRSLFLEACRFTLELKQRGEPIPPRLEKFVGYDNGVLKNVTCKLPYTNFEVNASGGVYVCCSHLVPTPIGNITAESAESIWNSEQAKRMRASVVDGSFRYCDHLNCELMGHESLPRQDSEAIKSDPVMGAAVLDNVFEVEPIEILSFGYDDSCNLSCPSCRPELRMMSWNEGKIGVEDKVAALLPSVKVLYLNPCGEVFVSKPSRRVLQAIDPQTCPDLKVFIISNGTLFSESEYNKFSNIHGKLAAVRISTDAATRETFETIRRGGRWDRFMENMRFLGRLRREGQIGFLFLSFTYQVGNFREMKAFVEMCEEIGADQAKFEKLLRTSDAMTLEEYDERAVHRPGHPLYQEYLEVIADPIFKQPNVYAAFD
jgi:hypothetical protein